MEPVHFLLHLNRRIEQVLRCPPPPEYAPSVLYDLNDIHYAHAGNGIAINPAYLDLVRVVCAILSHG